MMQKTKSETREYIQSDCFRYTGKCDRKTVNREYAVNSAFRFQVALRLCQSTGLYRFAGLVLLKFSRMKYTIRIDVSTQIGYGLYIGHAGPVVINPTTVIGDNCNLSQFTTIGSNEGKAATIGNNVYIGPSVCVVEDVEIGDNVTIGAGSVVTKDIPADATAAGNYAKVLNYRNPGRYIKNRWNPAGHCGIPD